jgi:hypothetical protein
LYSRAKRGHVEMGRRLLLATGDDPSIRDSMRNGDAIGWAEFFKQPEGVRILLE